MYEVLIVEDDPMVAMINKQYISQNPHFRISAICKDGESAFSYLQNNTIHLVVLDVYMPKEDGLSLLRKIRTLPIPVSVIMVTAANDSATIGECFRLGVVDYLVKPFESKRFQQALNTFLHRQNAFNNMDSFDQSHIDILLEGTQVKDGKLDLPKGLQSQTLEKITIFIENYSKEEWTIEEIADKIGISRVTVRRYINYLLDEGKVSSDINYETGGRPCMMYSLKK